MTSKLKASPFEIETYLINRGLQIRRRGKKAEIRNCPFCGGGEHRDLWTCVVYLDDDGGNHKCMRGSCGQAGSFWQLVEHFGDDPREFYEKVDSWLPKAPRTVRNASSLGLQPVATEPIFPKAPDVDPRPLTEAALEYLSLRGISPDLAEDAPVWCDERGNICFGYYHEGELCMVKVRRAGPTGEGETKAWQQWKGGLRTLWGLDRCDPAQGPLVIAFGEYDALALMQAGVPNAVSVPAGDQDLAWISICWDRLAEYDEIVLWPDNDASGHKALLEVSERLGGDRIRVVRSQYKDPNEHLWHRMQEVAEDADAEVRETVRTAEWLRPGEISALSAVVAEEQSYEGYTSGLAPLDRLTGGYFFGQLILHFGDTKHGKSVGANQVVSRAADQGGRVCVWAGEDMPGEFRQKIYTHVAGHEGTEARISARTGTEYALVRPEWAPAIDAWARDRFFLFAPRRMVDIDLLLENWLLARRRHGCDVFLADNLMKLVYAMTNGDNVLACQAKIVNALVDFAKSTRSIVHLVSHTKKRQGAKDHEPPDRESNSGAKEILNLCDRAQYWWRVPEIARHVYNTESVTGIVADRVFGNQGQVPVRYHAPTKRYGTSMEELGYRYALEGVYVD
jgi:hypothetical protein